MPVAAACNQACRSTQELATCWYLLVHAQAGVQLVKAASGANKEARRTLQARLAACKTSLTGAETGAERIQDAGPGDILKAKLPCMRALIV